MLTRLGGLVPDEAAHLLRQQERLRKTVSILRDQLIDEGKKSKDVTADRIQEQKVNENRLTETNTKIEAARFTILNLDKEYLEEIEQQHVFGAAVQTHKFKFPHRTRNFQFELSTDFPIHHVDSTPGITSKRWKSQTWAKGEKTFSAVLKNNPIRSAAGSVRLYGWRKEIHHKELSSEKKILSQELLRKADLEGKIRRLYRTVESLEGKNLEYKQAVDRCFADLEVLNCSSCFSHLDKARLQEYVKADSIYGVAALLQLKSNGHRESVHALIEAGNDGAPQALLHSQQLMLSNFDVYVHNMSELVDKVARQRTTQNTVFGGWTIRIADETVQDNTAEKLFRSTKTRIQGLSLRVDDERQKLLHQKCQETLKKLDGGITKFRKQNLEALQRIGRERAQASNCQHEMIELRAEVACDWYTNLIVWAMINAQQLPVGVLATVLDLNTLSLAYASIWRGLRLAMSEGRLERINNTKMLEMVGRDRLPRAIAANPSGSSMVPASFTPLWNLVTGTALR
jgi:hypothetical protein